jgi:MFS family permease
MSDAENTNVPSNPGPNSILPSRVDVTEAAGVVTDRKVSAASLRGLDWFAFFVADIQTGWGPFVAAYLTSVGWRQFDIGTVLTIGTMAGFVLQIPLGAMVDAVPAKRLLAAIAVTCISASALLLGTWPSFGAVVIAKLLHAVASCLVGPAMAAISLGLVGHVLLSVRLGRNARFLSLGNAIAAGVMGVIGYYFTNRAIFLFTAGLGVPTLIALAFIRSADIDADLARGGRPRDRTHPSYDALRALVYNRPLLIFAGVVFLFQLGNAAALPTMASLLAVRLPQAATLILSVCIFAPQFVVAAIAPVVGRRAESWGRRPLLGLCLLALAVRCACFAATSEPALVVTVQLLDGISAASLAVLVPLILADVMRGTGHYNLAQGVVGGAVGFGASLSTEIAGYISDHIGASGTFLFMAGAAATGLLLVVALMPETKGISEAAGATATLHSTRARS